LKYTRTIWIRKKIITEEDLKDLARVIVEEGEKFEGSKVKLELRYKGGLKESANDFSLFEKSIFFGKYVLQEVFYTMKEETSSRGIIIQLEHGNDGDNYIQIEGEDPDWVNGKVTQFEDIIHNWKRRFFNFSTMEDNEALLFAYLFIFGTLLVAILGDFAQEELKKLIPHATVAVFLVILSTRATEEFWPSVELDVRPSKLSTWRKIISGIIGTIFFGLVTNFLYDYFFK